MLLSRKFTSSKSKVFSPESSSNDAVVFMLQLYKCYGANTEFALIIDICVSRLQTLGSITCDQFGSKRSKTATKCLDWSRGLGVPKQPIGWLRSHATHGPLECVSPICVPQRYYKGGASSAGEHGKG